MAIRVAYDISILGHYFNLHESKTGVTRVIEEVLNQLNRRDEVEMTVMGLCGDDPIANSINAFLFVDHHKGGIPYRFNTTFRSRLGFSASYLNVFGPNRSETFRDIFQSQPKASAKSLYNRGLRSLLYRLYYVYKIDKVKLHFDHRQFDVFHSPYPKLPGREVTKGVPRVLTVYDLIPVLAPQFVTPESTVAYQQILESVDLERDWIVCISEFTKREFCDYTGMDERRVFVAPLAASPHFHQVEDSALLSDVRRRYHIPEGDYLLSIAALQPRKNLVHLIKCFFRLLREQPSLSVNLVLVGSKGWMYDEVFAAAGSSEELRSRVIFTGYVPEEDLSAIYSGALMFVYPSLYEGFGLPLLEAMQCGVPVVASDSTSLPEVVGDAGLTVGPGDADTLAQAMLRVIQNGALRDELRHKGVERAAEFSWERCAADTVTVYRAAVDGR